MAKGKPTKQPKDAKEVGNIDGNHQQQDDRPSKEYHSGMINNFIISGPASAPEPVIHHTRSEHHYIAPQQNDFHSHSELPRPAYVSSIPPSHSTHSGAVPEYYTKYTEEQYEPDFKRSLSNHVRLEYEAVLRKEQMHPLPCTNIETLRQLGDLVEEKKGGSYMIIIGNIEST